MLPARQLRRHPRLVRAPCSHLLFTPSVHTFHSHRLFTGILGSFEHPDNEPCDRCPSCVGLTAVTQLMKLSNHLELLKADREKTSDSARHTREQIFQKQKEFALMALGGEGNGLRDNKYLSKSSDVDCGKMQALGILLDEWRRAKQKVLLFSYCSLFLIWQVLLFSYCSHLLLTPSVHRCSSSRTRRRCSTSSPISSTAEA